MGQQQVRAIALIATYNEERFVAPCIEHLIHEGIDVYLIDNESTDGTVARAEPFLGHGLLEIETLPRPCGYSLTSIMTRKEELVAELDADWFVVQDADEFRDAPTPGGTLIEALSDVDRAGFNAVAFTEFVFLPTIEAPDHDHPHFRETMLSYYAFIPHSRHHIKAFKKQSQRVRLAAHAGHQAAFEDRRLSPERFPIRHYLFLSRAHAGEKYFGRTRPAAESERGWGGWRNTVAACSDAAMSELLELPAQRELRAYKGDGRLDDSDPLTSHAWMEAWAARIRPTLPG